MSTCSACGTTGAVQKLLQHVFGGKRTGRASLAWRLVCLEVAPPTRCEPVRRASTCGGAAGMRPYQRTPGNFCQLREEWGHGVQTRRTSSLTGWACTSHTKCYTTERSSTNQLNDRPATSHEDLPPIRTGSSLQHREETDERKRTTLANWKKLLHGIRHRQFSHTDFKMVWTHYMDRIRTDPAEMAKLGRDDWFSLMVITGQNKSLAGQEFADRADLLISDMEDAGQLPDAPMFEEWANHANIQTLADAEWFLRMVWWCASPATVSDELFATLMKRMSQKHDLEAIVKLYRQAVSSNRAGERTHFRMMKSYARLGAATKAITMFEEHFAERSSDEECSLLIKGTSHETALKLFNWIKKKKVAGPKTYERIIRVYCLSHLLPEASALCKEWTLEKQAPPTPAMFNALMWAYIRRGDSEAKDFVQEVEQSGEYLPMKSLEALMHLLGRKGDVDGALEILFRVEELSPGAMRTVWTYNIALGILARARTTDRFHEILDHMKQQNVEPDPVTYGTIMSGFNKCGRHQNVIDLFHFLMSKDMALNHAAISAVLMSLATLRRIEDMLTCFNGLRDNRRHELTVKHYTIVIDAYLKQGDLATAYEIFDVMAKDHKSPDVVTYSCFLDAYGRRDDLRGITKILNAMDSNQVVADAVVYNILIMAHSRRSRAKQALQAFADMITKDLKPSIYTYSAVVYALAKDGDFTACDELLVEMESVGVWPNSYTYAILIKEMMIRGDRQGALRYFNRYAPTGMDPAVDHRPKPRFDAKLSNTILRGLMQLNDIENALSVFKQLMHLGHMPTITEWMTIIEGVGKAGLVAECEGLYRRFLQLGKQEEGGGTKAEKGHVAPTLWACRKARQHVVAALVAKEGEAGVKEFVRREREGWKDLGPVDIFGIDLTPETM